MRKQNINNQQVTTQKHSLQKYIPFFTTVKYLLIYSTMQYKVPAFRYIFA